MRKAQIELATVLGVIIVIVVIVFYTLIIANQPPSPVPSGVGAEQSLVRDKVEGIISDGAALSVKWMESQGGAILPIFNNSVSFTRVMVPYWQKCDKTYVPSLDLLTRQLENATYNYIVYNLYNRSEIVLGKNVAVDLQATKVTANVLDNKIDLEVTMPTTVQGYAVQQPYRASIPTKFGEIYKFMKAYAEEAAKNRYIELFMINSIYFSKTIDDGGVAHAEVPTFGTMVECGETIYRTSEQLSDSMEGLALYTLSHVKWWVPAEKDFSKPKQYTIESLKGKTYPQLNPLFMVDDNFAINMGGGVSLTNPRPLASAPALFGFTTSGLCLKPYSISYSFQLPVMLVVSDPLMNDNKFSIATLIDINNLMPGSCGEIPKPQYCLLKPGNVTECTDNGQPPAYLCGNCTARMKVVAPDGSAVKGAVTSFGGCVLPATDSAGMTEGNVNCEPDYLTITYVKPVGVVSELYQKRSCGISPADLNGTITVYKYPKLNVHFREVNLTTCNASQTGNFFLVNTTSHSGCHESITNANVSSDVFCTDHISCSEQMAAARAEEKVAFELFEPGSHSISATVLKVSPTERREAGSMESSFSVTSSSTDIFINVPLYESAANISRDYTLSITDAMASKCGITPVEVRP
ncbi:MAG: hypothetical protein FJY76_01075 [Candidatus Aenigmarchaeota archaeon]|nr:hypothetical protein [Candidatus Aenigmarchaeota archaeon]